MNVDRLPDNPDDPNPAADTPRSSEASRPPDNPQSSPTESESEHHSAPDQQPRPERGPETHRPEQATGAAPNNAPDVSGSSEARSRQEHATLKQDAIREEHRTGNRDRDRTTTPKNTPDTARSGDGDEIEHKPSKARFAKEAWPKDPQGHSREDGHPAAEAAEVDDDPALDPHNPFNKKDSPGGGDEQSTVKEAEDSEPTEDVPPVHDRLRPLTNREWSEHQVEVRDGLDKARGAGLESHLLHTIDPDHQSWSKDRRSLQDTIINELYAADQQVPNDGQAVLAGGLGGAGKTTVLTEHAGIDLSKYLVINPDSLKEEMARRGMIPELEGLSPMEASDLVHEESSYLARQLALRAQADGKNIIWDITMSTQKSTEKRISDLRNAGYSHIDGLFVDIPVETSIRRTESRHREGYEQYRAGEGLGGRYLPPKVVERQSDPNCGSKNRKIFDTLKQKFNNWSIYDNSVDGRTAVLCQSSREQYRRSEE